MARTIADTATRAAVSRVGAKVCRQLSVGISERDWIRGTVLEIADGRIRVSVEDAGRYQHTLAGHTLARGVAFWDSPLPWTPCE